MWEVLTAQNKDKIVGDIESELRARVAHCDPELAGKTARRMLVFWLAGQRKIDVIDWVLFGTYPEDWSFDDV